MRITAALPRLFLLIFLLTSSSAWAAEIHGRSSTQLLWFISDFNSDRQIEMAQYLRLDVTRLDQAGRFNIYGYGRGSQDFSNGDGLNGRLYYLYGDYRDLFDKRLDVRLGRQFVNVSAGTALVDGVMGEIRNVGPVGFTLFGGRDVIFGLDGELGHEGNYVVGLGANLAGLRKTDLDLSWFRKWDSGDVSRDMLGATFKQYLYDNIKLYSNARFDITSEVFSEFLAGVKYFPNPNLVFTGEWFQSYPTFDTVSIFSVFAVERYREGVLRVDYHLSDQVSVNGGYNRQSYGDGGDADVVEAGVTLRPIPTLAVSLNYDHRNGYGGSLNGGMLDALWDVSKELQLGAGLTVDSYNRESFSSETGEQIAQKYWVGGKYKLARQMSASLRLDEDVNQSYDSNFQGRFIFNYDF